MHSEEKSSTVNAAPQLSLNPCFNGRCTRSVRFCNATDANQTVLILVLREDALGGLSTKLVIPVQNCLNPCFNGRCTRRKTLRLHSILMCRVLILVLMEDALGAASVPTNTPRSRSLNPCFNGRCTRRCIILHVLCENAVS